MEDQEEKTIDIVVQEYEQKLENQRKEYEQKIKDQDEKHSKEIRAILSGKNSLVQEKPTEEDEEKDFITLEIEKTKKNLKLK